MNFTAYRYDENDGSVTLSLNEIDLIENAPTEIEAKLNLAHAILEYSQEYINNIEKYSTALNRKHHSSFVSYALEVGDVNILSNMISVMYETNMPMKKLLLIMGDLACGKSTFANLLSKRYDTNVFGKDSIKEVLGDTIGFANREENLKLSRATMELMFFMFSEFTKLHKPLILESNFHTKELEMLRKMASERGYEVLTLVLRGDVELLHKRYLHRMQNENRHPVHLSTTLDVFEDFKGYTEYGRSEAIPGEYIEINANDFSYQTDMELLSKIDKFMK